MSNRRTRGVVAGGSALVSAGASSLTGLLVNLAAATTRDDVGFGYFSFVYIVVLAIMTLLRAVCGEVVLFTDLSPASIAARRNSTVTVAGLATVGAAGLVLLGATLDRVGYAAAFALIPVCVQDNYRYLAFVTHRPRVTATSDVITCLGPLAVVLFGRNSGDAAAAAFVAWGVAALAGSLVAERMMHPGHGTAPSASFAPELRALRNAALVEFMSTTLLYQIPLLALPAVITYADVGTMRGLQMAFSPVTVVHAALFALVIPRLTNVFEDRGRLSYGLIVVYMAVLGSLTVLIALVLSHTPSAWAARVLGSTSESVQDNAWAYASAQAAAIAATAATIVRRIDRTYGTVVRVRLASAIAAPILCLVGALWLGVVGACLGLAASQMLYLVLLRSPLLPATRADIS